MLAPVAIFSSVAAEIEDTTGGAIVLSSRLADGPVTMAYGWAGRPMDAVYWGFAMGDMDGDGMRDALLLERRGVRIGRLEGDGFRGEAACGWKGGAQAARLYLIDLDGDGDDEIVISAVEQGMPSSLALDYRDGKCRILVERARWSLRVIEAPEPLGAGAPKLLIGQGWSSQDFFSGPIYKLKLEGNKLKPLEKLVLPPQTKLYQFSLLPEAGARDSLIALKGFDRPEVHRREGGRFRRVWLGGERFGGGMNYMPAPQREVLGEKGAGFAVFDLPPLVVRNGEGYLVIAPQHDMPLKGFVGRRPYARGARLVGFGPDPVLTLTQIFQTVRLPGAVADYHIDITDKKGAKKLFVLLQEDPGLFHKSTASLILSFDIAVKAPSNR